MEQALVTEMGHPSIKVYPVVGDSIISTSIRKEGQWEGEHVFAMAK